MSPVGRRTRRPAGPPRLPKIVTATAISLPPDISSHAAWICFSQALGQGSLEYPLPNSLSGLEKRVDIIDVKVVQYRSNPLIQPVCSKKCSIGCGCCRKTAGNSDSEAAEVGLIISPSEAFLPPTISTSFMPSSASLMTYGSNAYSLVFPSRTWTINIEGEFNL